MNAKESSKLSMFEVVTALETLADPLTLAKMPGFTDHLTSLRAAVTAIRAELGLQLHFKAVSARDKQIARDTLLIHMSNVAAAVRAHAVAEKQLALADEFHLSEAALGRVRNNDLVEMARNIVTAANNNQSGIEAYGIQKSDITALEDQAAFFLSIIPSVRVSRVLQAEATKRLKLAFRTADDIIDLLDILAETLRTRDPEFYSDYRRRREITNPISHTIPLRGTVLSESGAPLGGVTVTIEGLPHRVKSTKTGSFSVRNLNDGIHHVHFDLDGYQSVKMPFAVTNGIRAKQTVTLSAL